jgi:hypothetical protein
MRESESASAWWEERRSSYNRALVIAGILAYITYVIVCETLLPSTADYEITVFTTLFHGIGYLLMMGVANVCFFLGPVSEKYFRPTDISSYRRLCYRLGFWFSVCLPFSIPMLLMLMSLISHGSFEDTP